MLGWVVNFSPGTTDLWAREGGSSSDNHSPTPLPNPNSPLQEFTKGGKQLNEKHGQAGTAKGTAGCSVPALPPGQVQRDAACAASLRSTHS